MSFLDFKTEHFLTIDEIPALLVSDPALYTFFSQKLVRDTPSTTSCHIRDIASAKSFIANYFKNCHNPQSDYSFCPNTLDFTNFIPQKPIISSDFSLSNYKFGQIEASFDGLDLDNEYILEIDCTNQRYFVEILDNYIIPRNLYIRLQAKLLIAHSLWGIKTAIVGYYYQDGIYVENKKTSRMNLIRLVLQRVDFEKEVGNQIETTVNNFVNMLENRIWDPQWNKNNDKH